VEANVADTYLLELLEASSKPETSLKFPTLKIDKNSREIDVFLWNFINGQFLLLSNYQINIHTKNCKRI